ncbi:Peptide-N4-N-acetyl-beta-glucosaminylasparagine amidase A [Hondaea fermentalgiana]|uniref:Peptide-N4-N-acetyl-beta-glucosaminylasparagine amidase A n=1 Tax=Hondaea fermentalgiana TaxID=2315210 RepID=A0A2R5G5I7_9STRA|nr:Peptide-N4-N-acetyl-beta-glucosaminylasparagine amidase A [Hondaea fermentalgiana]|eukprot:GBG26312.1 Peptide-N4-N-acetyl-beta-glucosaminylasparagine amidase A [Hondaea fermentalgiana]
MVVLEMEAAVDGRQFDRMGGFWIDNCKLLHLTTAEPLNPGRVAWSVERDVTPFARMLVGRSMPFDAILDIPNIVQGPYTGVINVTVRALIYYDPQRSMQLAPLPLVFPLRAPFRDPRSPLKGAIVSGTERLKLPPFRCEACGSSSVQLELALYSTGHGGAEEFYYLEAPGGSPFRELIVYLDGEPVAATVPFPVVYTGGINPLLWRPLSAILALNVPPYSLDLTPLAPLLGDGAEHYFEIGVLNNSKTGQWNIDPILLVSRMDVAQLCEH